MTQLKVGIEACLSAFTGYSASPVIRPVMKGAPYCDEFIDFINYATTVYHAIDYSVKNLEKVGYVQLVEDEEWSSKLQPGGKYYVIRNGTALVAFQIEDGYTPGEPFAIVASHVDSLTPKLKPVSKSEKGGFERLGVAPYSGGGASQSWDASYSTWWDRDLGIGGSVLVKGNDGHIRSRLVSLGRPVARIPSLAIHFGAPALGPFNYETNFVPIIGLAPSDSEDSTASASTSNPTATGGTFGPLPKRHSQKLLKAISGELGISPSRIVDFSLELFDFQPASLLGLSQEFISGPRLDDKLCSFSALWALINASSKNSDHGTGSEKRKAAKTRGGIQMIAFFDNEEIGSMLRHGAKGNFLQSVIERVVEAQPGVSTKKKTANTRNLIAQTIARSFMVSADVSHAFNPNFSEQYLPGLSPELNKGMVFKLDPNGHYTTDAPGVVLMRLISERCGCEVQMIHNRNDSRTGSTIGPTLSERLGIPAIDVGIPQLSMHSIRAITGNKDPGLGVKFFEGFLREWASVSRTVEL